MKFVILITASLWLYGHKCRASNVNVLGYCTICNVYGILSVVFPLLSWSTVTMEFWNEKTNNKQLSLLVVLMQSKT